MKQKWWFLPATVLVVFGLLMMGCPSSGGDDDDDDDATTAFSYDFKGDGSEYTLWGDDKPVLEDGSMVIKAGSSTGFQIKFETIGYTYKASDTLVFTYSVEVETPEACLTAKNPAKWDGDLGNGANWGVGKGREYYLGSAKWSAYEGPEVAGTWDAAAKEGTFEISMKFLGVATGVAFQHNVWAESPDDKSKTAENSKYKLKFLKVENKAGAAVTCECDGNANNCTLCSDPCPCDPCDLPIVDTNKFPAFTNATKLTVFNTGAKGWSFGEGDDKAATLEAYFAAKYFVIASIGGGNKDGFGGVQFGTQGDGESPHDWKMTVYKSGDWTSFAHDMEEDVVYFVFNLADFDNLAGLKTANPTQAQFVINYGLGSVIKEEALVGYLTGADLSTKPADAEDFAAGDPALKGYITKNVALTK
jgi:hypothetical protein